MRHVPSLIGCKLGLTRYRCRNRTIVGIAEFDHDEAECGIEQQLRIRGLRMHRGVLSIE